jgi:hypothetical protein
VDNLDFSKLKPQLFNASVLGFFVFWGFFFFLLQDRVSLCSVSWFSRQRSLLANLMTYAIQDLHGREREKERERKTRECHSAYLEVRGQL